MCCMKADHFTSAVSTESTAGFTETNKLFPVGTKTFKTRLYSKHIQYFNIRDEALRTEGAVCCTDCKAPEGKFIFGYTGL